MANPHSSSPQFPCGIDQGIYTRKIAKANVAEILFGSLLSRVIRLIGACSKPVVARIQHGDGILCARFFASTGQLHVIENARVVCALDAPDSWMALAQANRASDWGTRPREADLSAFLQLYAGDASHGVTAVVTAQSPSTAKGLS